jgi:hypothetical protein
MSPSSPDTPPIEVPEADWAEQAVAVDPLAEADADAEPNGNAVPRKHLYTARTTTAASWQLETGRLLLGQTGHKPHQIRWFPCCW